VELLTKLRIDSCTQSTSTSTPKESKPLTYDIYKPKANFKKSKPGPADFHLMVCDASSAQIPSLYDIQRAFRELPPASPSPAGASEGEKRKKDSSIIFAAVDHGVTSFIKCSQASRRLRLV